MLKSNHFFTIIPLTLIPILVQADENSDFWCNDIFQVSNCTVLGQTDTKAERDDKLDKAFGKGFDDIVEGTIKIDSDDNSGETTVTNGSDGTDLGDSSDETTVTNGSDGTDLWDSSDETTVTNGSDETDLEDNFDETTVINGSDETDLEDNFDETTVTNGSDGTNLEDNFDETTVINGSDETDLGDNFSETTVINGSDETDLEDNFDETTVINVSGETDLEDNFDETTVINGSDGIDLNKELVESLDKESVNDFGVSITYEPVKLSTPTTLTKSCPESNKIHTYCTFNNKEIGDIFIAENASVSNAILTGKMETHGWASNLIVEAGAMITGLNSDSDEIEGILTGTIINNGTIENIAFHGASISGGILGGTIFNNSIIDGICDVKLASNTHIIGGELCGDIIGNDFDNKALLEKLVITGNGVLKNVIIGKEVDIADTIKVDESVEFIP
ncbi:hypothetical protein QUF74_00030 [Candidatus Halobeggiatoa sp. HSG11]|nr:hypothetical protein [Candidatus Halobeggiatoa sp. HSG11]